MIPIHFLTSSLGQIVSIVYVGINLFALLVMANDKRKSKHGPSLSRTPEGFIFFLATALGAVGVYLGMQLFRHKTQKWYFQIGIPLLILQNIVIVYVAWNSIGN